MSAKLPRRQASIQFFGRLTRDPELKFDPQGKATCGFSVAVERWTGKERVSWFANCRVFGKPAEAFAEAAKKGNPVYITGEPYMEGWETKDGEKRKDFKVFVNTADVLEWAEDGDRQPSRPAQRAARPAPPVDEDSEIPF